MSGMTTPRTLPTRRSSTDLKDASGDIEDIKAARTLLLLGDSVTTDHISPAGNIRAD